MGGLALLVQLGPICVFLTQTDQNQTCFESEIFAAITLCSALVLLEVLLDLHGCPGGESLRNPELEGEGA